MKLLHKLIIAIVSSVMVVMTILGTLSLHETKKALTTQTNQFLNISAHEMKNEIEDNDKQIKTIAKIIATSRNFTDFAQSNRQQEISDFLEQQL